MDRARFGRAETAMKGRTMQRTPTTHFARRTLLGRAALVAGAAILTACTRAQPRAATPTPPDVAAATDVPTDMSLVVSARAGADAIPFRRAEFGIVGVFDVDWLTDPGFAHLLDNLAASPGAFRGVRFFGALSSGTREKTEPGDHSGTLWPNPAAPPDFSATLDALHALTSRGLVPFVQLSFFPAAVVPAPTTPPQTWGNWQTLVRRFLDTLAADPRFGAGVLRDWWFEVWNEPNIPVFWRGTFDQYLDCYRATDAAVRATGYPIRLGGPALAYLPPAAGPSAGAPLMRRFLAFLRDEPDVRCDFLSFHQKGTWADAAPSLDDLATAAEEVAAMARTIVPERARDLPIINNEADEKVGFDTPYAPRMDERAAAWLAATIVIHDTLSVTHHDVGLRFHAAADNANLQLVREPFDGRRSLMTRTAPAATTDLLKLPVYGAYELLALLGEQHGTILRGGEWCYPASDLFHLVTVAPTHLSALFTVYPRGDANASSDPRDIAYTFTDIPWQTVNIARFQIDAMHTNAYVVAGRRLSPMLDPAGIGVLRQAQELGVFAPIRQAVSVSGGALTERFTIAPYTTLLFWVTPHTPDVPAAPRGVYADRLGGNVVIRWEPSREPACYSYEVFLMDGTEARERLSPLPLRAALWVETAPPPGPYTYGVRAVTASGVPGPLVTVAI